MHSIGQVWRFEHDRSDRPSDWRILETPNGEGLYQCICVTPNNVYRTGDVLHWKMSSDSWTLVSSPEHDHTVQIKLLNKVIDHIKNFRDVELAMDLDHRITPGSPAVANILMAEIRAKFLFPLEHKES